MIKNRINESKFIKGLQNPNNDNPQTLEESIGDRQTDTIISFISLLLFFQNISPFTIIDYGCGGFGNLFFNLFKYNKSSCDFIKNLNYIGIDLDEKIFDNIKLNMFNETISNFGNSLKDISDVFMSINLYINKIQNKKYLKADMVILKNVIHEIELKDFPQLIINLSQIINENGLILIYDFQDFIYGENQFRIPWRLEDSRKLLDFLEFEVLREINSSYYLEKDDLNNKTPLYLILGRKTNTYNNDKTDGEIKDYLINYFDIRKNEYLVAYKNLEREKTTCAVNLEIYKEISAKSIKYSTYLSNITIQIENAIQDWGL